jgi:hypothetical protein
MCENTELNRIRAKLSTTLTLLKKIEWQGDEFGERCADCGGRDLPNDPDSQKWAKTLGTHCGHAPDCRLATLINQYS